MLRRWSLEGADSRSKCLDKNSDDSRDAFAVVGKSTDAVDEETTRVTRILVLSIRGSKCRIALCVIIHLCGTGMQGTGESMKASPHADT